MGKKEEFLKWYRDNRKKLNDEEMRWASEIIEEFQWHDKLETVVEDHISRKTSAYDYAMQMKPILPFLDGLDARLMLDWSLCFEGYQQPTEAIRGWDLKLAAYCKNRSNTEVIYSSDKDCVYIMRYIKDSAGNVLGYFRSNFYPCFLYPELTSLYKGIPKEKQKELRKKKFQKEKQMREEYDIDMKPFFYNPSASDIRIRDRFKLPERK